MAFRPLLAEGLAFRSLDNFKKNHKTAIAFVKRALLVGCTISPGVKICLHDCYRFRNRYSLPGKGRHNRADNTSAQISFLNLSGGKALREGIVA